MRLLFINHIQNAHDSLRANRMRTFLTISGVAIGIASIIAILSLATSASKVVGEQVDGIGGNIAVIRPGSMETHSFTDLINQQAHRSASVSTLTDSDVEQIRALDSVTAAAPIMLASTALVGESETTSTLLGTTPKLLEMSGVTVRDGDFTNSDQALITIGSQLSIDLFGTEDSLGKTITVRGEIYRVGGVIERQKNPMNFNGVDFDRAALVNQTRFTSLYSSAPIQQINIQSDSVANLGKAVEDVNKVLLEQHGNEQDFRVLTGDDIAAPTGQLFSVVAGVTATIAAISLFVGGIGIMNIMLVNVAERTREIGIRKALGATRNDIVWQFLIESIIMALLGGILGCLLGLLTAFIASLFLTFNPALTWSIAFIAVGVSSLVGVVFGLYPALRAAHKNPIESLTQHH